jgi:multidrug resistance efflux pump
MSAPLSSTGRAADLSAWHELEEVLAELAALARLQPPPHEFYRHVLEQTLRALSAVGGAVWLRSENGALQPVTQSNWRPGQFAADEHARRGHEAILHDAAAMGRIVSVAPGAEGNSTDCLLLAAPVQARRQNASGPAATLALVEVLARADASPSAHRGYEQFLAAVCDLAADYHTFRELARLQQNESYREQLLRLSRTVHQHPDVQATAFAIANDGRLVVECDRLSVLRLVGGRRCRLLATSGAQRVERRSTAARDLEKLGQVVGRLGEAAYYGDGQSDALPQVAEALEQHAETSQARQIAVVPVRSDAQPAVQFVLIAEQFDARHAEPHCERLVEVAEVAAPALTNAAALDQLPLVWLLRPLGRLKQRAVARWSRTAFILAAVVSAIAALVLVPADFNIEATGTLQPAVRRAAFAPRSGLVDAVLVKHGEDVTAGQPLVRLRDPALELETKRVHGELETAQRQIEAVRAARTARAVREANPADAYRLSAEERELDQRLANLRRELELLNEETKKLLVTSPIAGRVLTWNVAERLLARPVERGESLVSVADIAAPWQLELDVPDDRIGHVLAATQQFGPELPVRFRLSSDQRESAAADGRLTEIARTADVNADPGSRPTPTVRINVAFEKDQLSEAVRSELRPGVSARAQIACGRRPLGYVWLHDIWDTVIGWLRF